MKDDTSANTNMANGEVGKSEQTMSDSYSVPDDFYDKLRRGEYDERLVEIRRILEEDSKREKPELETIDIDLDEDALKILEAITAEFGITANEYCWLLFEEIIKHAKEHES